LKELCGKRNYVIKDATATTITTWASIAAHASTDGSMTLTIDTTQYPNAISSATKVETLTITTTLDDWAGATVSNTNIVVTINRLGCNCDRLLWVAPTVQTVTVNIGATTTLPVTDPGSKFFPAADTDIAATRTAHADFNACYEMSPATDCTPSGGSYSAANVKYEATPGSSPVALPSSPSTWMAFTDGAQSFTIAPQTADTTLVGVYKVYATYTAPASRGTPAEFHILTVTIDCVVTSFTKPAAPTGADL
jgi:hypothetical protein